MIRSLGFIGLCAIVCVQLVFTFSHVWSSSSEVVEAGIASYAQSEVGGLRKLSANAMHRKSGFVMKDLRVGEKKKRDLKAAETRESPRSSQIDRGSSDIT